MRIRTVLWAPAAALALALACAPGDPPRPDGPGDTKSGDDKPVKPVSPDQLAERVKLALKQVRQRDLLTTNSFWTVFHGILGMGPGTELVNPDTRERVNAIDYISKGGA